MIVQIIGAFAISLILVLLIMPHYIKKLKKISFNQSVSEYSLDQYKEKAKTPTMGGVLFVVVPIIITFLFNPSLIHDLDTLIVLLAFAGYGLIGFIDDYIIVIRKDNTGLKPKYKFALQLLLAIVFYLLYQSHASLGVTVPFVKAIIPLGTFYAFFCFIMFTGMSNAVNLTDGMDGLAAGCSLISFIPFLLVAIYQGKMDLVVFIASLMGALIGYLRYNIYPAKIFMGDAGSLALGGVMAALAMVLKIELAMLIICGVFVWETLCVVIQIGSVKLRGKRVFKYTPIHYSFVISGMSEKRVVRSFWILSLICATIGIFAGLF